MSTHNFGVVPLQQAYLCLDCELITPAEQGHCAACSSQALLGIAAVLSRRESYSSIIGRNAARHCERSERTMRRIREQNLFAQPIRSANPRAKNRAIAVTDQFMRMLSGSFNADDLRGEKDSSHQ